ncbi:hypothetical protein [Nocardia sp. NPDC005745]|uniref:hypothetical protein n=1 Tax=Nocardia sp. NPDC005745 TaxID=3157061 RepID=UPI0033E976FB
MTPGFYRRPDLHGEAFDAEGFLRTGDLVSFVDQHDPNKGLLFGGRMVENFKLSTGTFVHVGALRPKLLSAAGKLLQDAVICGHDGDFVAALVWLHPDHVKGYINQRAVRENRADLVRELTAAGPSARSISRVPAATTEIR